MLYCGVCWRFIVGVCSPQMEVDTVLSDFESSDFGEMVRLVELFQIIETDCFVRP